MAVVDIAGFIADLKDHAAEHGFHVHDERHFVETYSMRQAFEVDLHPEAACGGPLDLHLSLDLEPRTLMAFEDEVMSLPEDVDPSDDLVVQLMFTWALPPLEHGPDLLVLATELAGLGGPDLPTQVSAVDSFEMVTDAPQRSIGVTARLETPLASLFRGDDTNWMCDALDRSRPSASTCSTRRRPGWARRPDRPVTLASPTTAGRMACGGIRSWASP
ncbi:MAG: hypothetical protein Ct9H300mP31_07920 [Acidimicrobiaceae bacterium]|nr:MAG: hypothetical protein Ct9H300mP31_07920 [Acidimicrobiaceae bacterium]